MQVPTLGALSANIPTFMLFGGQDQWAPFSLMIDIAKLQSRNILSSNIFMTYLPELRHDYVSYDDMPAKVQNWCFSCITSIPVAKKSSLRKKDNNINLRSKL
jgi:hypothetical protein